MVEEAEEYLQLAAGCLAAWMAMQMGASGVSSKELRGSAAQAAMVVAAAMLLSPEASAAGMEVVALEVAAGRLATLVLLAGARVGAERL